jgi:thiamine-phosphate pyrophosphorylase
MSSPTLVKPEQLRLYLVTDNSLCRDRPLDEVVAAAVHGGATCVQLREKRLATHDFVARAVALKTWLAPLGIPLVINDRLDIALACEADGVHLGQSDMSVETARRLLPAHVFIGWSVETPEDVHRAAGLPVDYLGVSPVFATSTKTDTHTPWGLEGLRQVRTQTSLPLVAIGGINDSNAADVVQAGADGLAVVSAICSAQDPKLAAEKLLSIASPHFTKASP